MTSAICMTGWRGGASKSHAAGGCRRLRAWRCSIGLWSVRRGDGRWQLAGGTGKGLINDYLGYLADRGYSPQTVRAYAFDLQAFARWLAAGRLALGEVSADVVLRYLAYCRRALLPGRAGGGPVRLLGDAGPGCAQPLPRRAEARRAAAGERGWLLAHLARPKRRSGPRVREPRRLPRGLDRAETTALLASFRTD